MPEAGDFARKYILDHIMIERALDAEPQTALDIGCGEGRFCRMLRKYSIQAIGIDPVEPMIRQCQQQDPDGTYISAFAENLPFEDACFDLAVFYLSLIDIDDVHAAVGEAERVLRPGGRLLIANLTSFFTSNGTIGWITGDDGNRYHPLGTYLE